MRELLRRTGKTNVFPVLSILLAGYFFYAFSAAVGMPPATSLNGGSAIYLVLAIFFFVMPEVGRLHSAKLREYETQAHEAKNEVQELKSETRALMSAYNGLIFSVGNATNHLVNLNSLPTSEDIQEAKRELNAALGDETRQTQLAMEIELFLKEEDSDFESALWDLRRVMEKELRRILRQDSANSEGSVRFLSSSALFDEFVRRYPNYGAMYSAFHYVRKICDAALHGREIPDSFVQEAFQMGFRIIGALRQVVPAGQASEAEASEAA